MTHHARGPRAAGPRRPAAPVLALAAAALALVGLLLPAAGGSAAPGPSAGADAAMAWLDAEVAANGGTMPGFSPGSTDWGLTADVALARAATGRAGEPATVALATALVGAVDDYSTWDGLGPAFAGVRVSGALAKVVLVGRLAGVEVSPAGGVDLEVELRGLMQATGPQAGRFSDRNPYAADKSNGFDQAYALLALEAGPGEAPVSGLQYLLAQQCPGGGFRLVYADDGGCGSDGQADPDATALAVQVLLAVPPTAGVEAALTEAALAGALGWLLAVQQPDGAVVGSPPTERPNANSTGLVGLALRAAGQAEAADRAAAWVAGELQLGAHAVGTPAEADTGAIAYEPARRAGALASGIAPQGRDQWRRASAQGLLALGAEPFLGPPVGAPVTPAPTPDPAPATTTTAPSGTPAGSAPTSPDGAEPPAPSPVVAPTDTPAAVAAPGSAAGGGGSAVTPAAAGASGAAGSTTAAAAGSSAAGSSATGSSAAGSSAGKLAFSGWEQARVVWTGLALVVAGAAAVVAGLCSRRSRRPAWHRG